MPGGQAEFLRVPMGHFGPVKVPDGPPDEHFLEQAHVKRWIDDLMPLLCGDGDPLGVEDLCTHRLPLEKAPARL